MNVGSLFTGIGGFDLGLERAGMRVVWSCERDDFCRRVLARHWPHVPCYEDVSSLRGADVERVDVLCGGFPCQGLSDAGLKLGFADPRSGLWSEFARLIGEVRPDYVIVENVAALRRRGLGRVLGDLAALGYDAEWDCLPASAFGAPHRRDRVWLVAYPSRDLSAGASSSGTEWERARSSGQREDVADAERVEGSERHHAPSERRRQDEAEQAWLGGRGAGAVADSERTGLQGCSGRRESGARRPSGIATGIGEGFGGEWEPEPEVGRVAHGIPQRVDRLRSLGNALVPQIAQWLGERILAYENERLTRA